MNRAHGKEWRKATEKVQWKMVLGIGEVVYRSSFASSATEELENQSVK